MRLKPGSLGRALPGHHVAIIDDQGNELPAGIEGDLAVRGRPPTLFAGYWELPEETKSAFLGDWYLTGDVAHVDEEGFFTFLGRAEDVITSSGGTFGPFDVERVLTGHQAIAAAAVVGIRDLQRGGHFVRAFVVPKTGAEGSEQLEAELRQYVAQTLPDPQVPREIVFVDELPIVGPEGQPPRAPRATARQGDRSGRCRRRRSPRWRALLRSRHRSTVSSPRASIAVSRRHSRSHSCPSHTRRATRARAALPRRAAPEPPPVQPESVLPAPEPVAEALPQPEPEPVVEVVPSRNRSRSRARRRGGSRSRARTRTEVEPEPLAEPELEAAPEPELGAGAGARAGA